MKRLATACLTGFGLLLLAAAPALAQPTLYGFNCVADDTTYFSQAYTGDTNSNLGTSDKPYINLADYDATDVVEGPCALDVDWQIYTNQPWGGFLQLTHVQPDSLPLYDLSDYTHLRLYYKNTQPTSSGQVEMRLNLFDASGGVRSGEAGAEQWYSQTAQILPTPAETGWTFYDMPLVDNGGGAPIADAGYSLPGWAGGTDNGELDLDMISGYIIEWTATPIAGDSTANGNIVFDNLIPVGVRYNVVEDFDGDESYEIAGTGGSIDFTTVTDSPFEGAGTANMDWTVVASESWGGFTNALHSQETPFDDMSERTHLSVFYNITQKPEVEGMLFRFKLIEGSGEEWVYEDGTMLYGDEGFQRLLMPLVVADAMGTGGFVVPPWLSAVDGVLDLDDITKYVIEFVAPGSLQGQTITGSVMFDRMTGYGFRNTDVTAPNAVTGLDATPGDKANIVTWEDVPGETEETYTIYYSLFPITDLMSVDVDVAASGIARGTQVFTHPLVAPQTDQDVTYYYAITATDGASNTSDTATIGPVTNEAKGIVTISMATLTGFTADGDLSDWAGITPIVLAPSAGSKVITNTTVNDDQDLSTQIYLALGTDALYIAFDITDDMFEPTGAQNPWENDGTELYIGLYDAHGKKHGGYQTEAEPDYKFVFYGSEVRLDRPEDQGGGVIYEIAEENYSVTEKFPSGYVIEAKLPYDAFAYATAPAFTPKNGMRIPLDFVIQDQDNGSREGIMVYSRDNDDNSWASPSNWAFTWIGDQMAVPYEDERGDLPTAFDLAQNYPNPFQRQTMIAYALPEAATVTVTVFDALGRRVRTIDTGMQAAGTRTLTLSADGLAPGLYVYQLRAGDHISSKKMLVVR